MRRMPHFFPHAVRWGYGRVAFVVLVTLLSSHGAGEPVAVRHREGTVHGFLILRALDGTALGNGDLLQTARGETVTSRLVFRFNDGSLHDETAIFSQAGHFRLLTDHLVQKGPSFPHPIDMAIDASKGDVVVRYSDKGQTRTADEHLDLPPDLANGLVLTLLKNLATSTPPMSVTFVAPTPRPQLVKLNVSVAGRERFSTGGARRTATHYVIKVEIGGLKGLLAPLVGKQPPDSHVWILGGEVPAFVKAEQPFYVGGPVWRIELVSPVWS